jgi:hypothetical protein
MSTADTRILSELADDLGYMDAAGASGTGEASAAYSPHEVGEAVREIQPGRSGEGGSAIRGGALQLLPDGQGIGQADTGVNTSRVFRLDAVGVLEDHIDALHDVELSMDVMDEDHGKWVWAIFLSSR